MSTCNYGKPYQAHAYLESILRSHDYVNFLLY